MKKTILALVAIGVLTAAVAAEKENSGVKSETKQLRVLAAPEAGRRVVIDRRESMEKETVTFLGVETAPASATLAAQLGLPKGSGLVVHAIVPDSAAAGVLQPHDILLKFEDQLLIEQRQLSVLIRQRNAGDEVTLTFLRGGKQTTAKVKLGTRDMPKVSQFFTAPVGEAAQAFAFSPGHFQFGDMAALTEPHEPEDVDRVLSLIERRPHEPFTMHIDRAGEPGFRAMKVNPANSNLVFSDDAGSLELTIKDGEKTLIAKDPKGTELFSGPVTTSEQRSAMPEDVRRRLEQLEGMHDITFKTGADFRGSETKIVRPLGRGVSLPLPGRRVSQPRRSVLL